MYDVDAIRADFPILSRQVNGKPLVYLDNGASAQKPQVVIDAVTRAYAEEYANVHRGLHYLSNLATEKYEGVRAILARFMGVADADQIVFNSGTTEGINTVAYGWAMPNLQPGDEIVLSVMEHHANIVPWHFLRERQGAVIKWVDVDAKGDLDPQAVIDAIGPKTKLVAVTHMSNVLGSVVDVKAITAGARAKGVPVLVDGSQSAVHMPIDVDDIGCDFYAITGHKLYGPSGSGGLGVALDYMMQTGMDAIAAHEADLRDYAAEKLHGLNWLQVQGTSPTKGPIFSFTMDGAGHAHDISTILDKKGVAVRAGAHCAGPLMEHLGTPATCRASFAMYNTRAEVDALVDALELAHDLFA